ncbi:MAG: cell division protein CrgA [Actinomycetota bacterium]
MPESKRRKTKKNRRPMVGALATATKAKAKEPSPSWYVLVMAGLMGAGVVAIMLRFIFQWSQLWLIGGLVAIAAGFLMTTNYR